MVAGVVSKICFKLCASVFAVFGQSGDDRCGDIALLGTELIYVSCDLLCDCISARFGWDYDFFRRRFVSTMVMHPLSFGFSAADDFVGFVVSVGLFSSFGFAVVVGSVAVVVGSVA